MTHAVRRPRATALVVAVDVFGGLSRLGPTAAKEKGGWADERYSSPHISQVWSCEEFAEGRRRFCRMAGTGSRPPWGGLGGSTMISLVAGLLRAALRQRRRCAIGRGRAPIRSATGNRTPWRTSPA